MKTIQKLSSEDLAAVVGGNSSAEALQKALRNQLGIQLSIQQITADFRAISDALENENAVGDITERIGNS